MKMSGHVLFCTQEEKRGFTVTEPETIYGMRRAPEAKKAGGVCQGERSADI